MGKQLIVKTETTVTSSQSAAVLDGIAGVEDLIAQFNEAKHAMKIFKEQKEAAEAALRELMGEAQVGLIAGVERVKIAARVRKEINKEDLKTAFPEAYELCMQENAYTVLTAVS